MPSLQDSRDVGALRFTGFAPCAALCRPIRGSLLVILSWEHAYYRQFISVCKMGVQKYHLKYG